MIEPDDKRPGNIVQRALAAIEPSAPEFAGAMRAARTRQRRRQLPLYAAGIIVVVAAAAGLAATNAGGSEQRSDHLVAAAPQLSASNEPTVSATEGQAPPRAHETIRAEGSPTAKSSQTSASGERTAEPTAAAHPSSSAGAQTVRGRLVQAASPEVVGPTEGAAPMTLSLRLSQATVSQGDVLRADVTVTNTGSEDLYLPEDTDCGQAFGSLSAPGLTFTSKGDTCLKSGVTRLPVGQSITQGGTAVIGSQESSKAIPVQASTSYTTQASNNSAAKVARQVMLKLNIVATPAGTRSFSFTNDQSTGIRLFCGCPGGDATYGGILLEPGQEVQTRASVYALAQWRPRNSNEAPRCLPFADGPESGEHYLASDAQACPSK